MSRVHIASCLLTGGAGFIGSHLAERLADLGMNVTIADNLSSGRLKNISRLIDSKAVRFVRGDLVDGSYLNGLGEADTIFHLAANPDVKSSATDPEAFMQNNINATFALLERARRMESLERFVFVSSSTVYGEPHVLPTPENYGPLYPISILGASKLACEALIYSYAHSYGFPLTIFRLANIVGERNGHGVVYDFVEKLRHDNSKLEILGNGRQRKSYLHVGDCVDAILTGVSGSTARFEAFNVGSDDQIEVSTIARLVIEEMGYTDVKLVFNNQFGGRGWVGDVTNMLLDTSKLRALGWVPRLSSEEAVRRTVRSLIARETETT